MFREGVCPFTYFIVQSFDKCFCSAKKQNCIAPGNLAIARDNGDGWNSAGLLWMPFKFDDFLDYMLILKIFIVYLEQKWMEILKFYAK